MITAAAVPDLGTNLVVLGTLLIGAYILGRAGKTIGLPAIPIYMVVGFLASPNNGWFPLNFRSDYIELIAVFGLLLLLFNLGLEFDQDEFFGNAGKLLISGGSYLVLLMGAGLIFGFALGWGTKEALIIAGIIGTSSSAIVTKLLIELRRLANRETPMILGVTVVQDIFLAIYLAIVSVILSGENEPWLVAGKLAIAFTFLVVMFTIARWGGAFVGRLFRTKDDELFTILFFGLAVLFGGLGEVLGVSDAIGAFLIGLVLGATRYSAKIEHVAVPLRDVFGAFFFLNFGLGLDPTEFPLVIWPVIVAVVLTLVLNVVAGQFMARLYGFSAQAGINAAAILMNRGEFALILAILALTAGLDPRLQPFAGLYVLVVSVMGPLLASNSERIGAAVLRTKRKTPARPVDPMLAEEIALVEAATSGDAAPNPTKTARVVDRIVEQAMNSTDTKPDPTKRDDDY
ncbi:cation:proton antiporter [Mycetocola zhadangensis]|uniref:Cation:proton antiporter n=1 Tax=Mycetocola zhadangensis TaxID=1164595 RepID=A0A3L7J4J6_9MICO|nr:cation:proton antiporter [Mycetocola zhadangensis]RLQ85454.1 cation:proton antiporter [Mycetocola zhadangensis]GGE82715.1 transporter [Mycetocola zhadangensis]